MTKVIGVRFRPAGKIYFFAPGKLNIKTGDKVIVETARGVEYGSVVVGEKEVEDDKITLLKPVIRIATEEDKKKEEKNRVKEKEAFEICLEKIRKHGLEMKLIDAEYTFDNNKVLFYFTADGRIDFRELVKDLAVYSALVSNCADRESEMRQRSEAVSESAEDRCAVTPIYQSLRRYQSRWRRNRTFR